MLLTEARGSGQCCGSALVSMQIRIRFQHFRSMRFRIQDFDDERNVKNLQLKKNY
jgi:hypothetical protein